MTIQDKITALAELDGEELCDGICGIHECTLTRTGKDTDYLTSYDASIRLIQKQDTYTQAKVEDLVLGLPSMFGATPAQLCDALLKAIGKWKD